MQKINSNTFDFQLPALSYIPPCQDEALSIEKKQSVIEQISNLLAKNSRALNSNHLPDLFFLRERVQRLSKNDTPLVTTINNLISQIGRPVEGTQESCLNELALLALNIDQMTSDDPGRQLLQSKFSGRALHYFQMKKYFGQSVLDLIGKITSQPKNEAFYYSNLFSALRITSLISNFEIFKHEEPYKQFLDDLGRHGINVEKLIADGTDNGPLPDPLNYIFLMMANIPQDNAPSSEILQSLTRNRLLQNIAVEFPTYHIHNDDKKDISIAALCIGVFLKDYQLVKMILKLGHKASQTDNQDYTASHFAAMMANLPMLFLLKQHGADFSCKNILGASVYDILRARGYARSDKNIQIVTYKDQKCTLLEFETQFKRAYMPESKFTYGALIALWWMKRSPRDFAFEEEYKRSVYETYVKIKQSGSFFQPPVYLNKMEKGEDGLPSPLAGDLEVLASRTIEPGEIIFEYTGEATETPKQDGRSYILALGSCYPIVIDAAKGGSYAELINHGAANCLPMIVIYQGIPRYVFYAIRRIEKDKPLLFNYGPQYFNNNYFSSIFHELSPKIVDTFIQQTKGLKDFSPYEVTLLNDRRDEWQLQFSSGKWILTRQRLSDKKLIKEKELQSLNTKEMLRYILSFPDRMLQLIEMGKMDAQNVIDLLNIRLELKSFQANCNLTAESIADLTQRAKAAEAKRNKH